MLSAKDKLSIDRDMDKAISDWRVDIKLYNTLPLANQPNYNPRLKSFDGPEKYSATDAYLEKDDFFENRMTPNMAGEKIDGDSVLHIPIKFDSYVTPNTIVGMPDGTFWTINFMDHSPGEIMLRVRKRTGGTNGDFT